MGHCVLVPVCIHHELLLGGTSLLDDGAEESTSTQIPVSGCPPQTGALAELRMKLYFGVDHHDSSYGMKCLLLGTKLMGGNSAVSRGPERCIELHMGLMRYGCCFSGSRKVH